MSSRELLNIFLRENIGVNIISNPLKLLPLTTE